MGEAKSKFGIITILTKSLKIDKPRLVFIFPLIQAINNERIALAKSENNDLQH